MEFPTLRPLVAFSAKTIHFPNPSPYGILLLFRHFRKSPREANPGIFLDSSTRNVDIYEKRGRLPAQSSRASILFPMPPPPQGCGYYEKTFITTQNPYFCMGVVTLVSIITESEEIIPSFLYSFLSSGGNSAFRSAHDA